MEEDNDEIPEELTEEHLTLISKAFINFTERFSDYVKETDPELWKRARDFAADYVDVPGVKIEIVDEDEDDRNSSNKNGAD
jgi:hypothetical protein